MGKHISGAIFQLERYLFDRYLIRFTTATIIVVGLAVATSALTEKMSQNPIPVGSGGDFAAFYIAGKIARAGQLEQVYDLQLHSRMYHQMFPDAPPDSQLPYVNAPFFLTPFIPLAELSYPAAYLGWVLISSGLYLAGLLFIRSTIPAMPGCTWITALLLAFSFVPFMFYCLVGGQTAAFGFFALALSFCCERKGLSVLSGAAMALCLYKPTLLLLMLPMLVVTRRFHTLAGFMVGSLVLALFSLYMVDLQGMGDYVNMLLFFSNHATDTVSGLKSVLYVDINAFFRLLAGEHTYLRWGLLLAVAGPLLFFIFRFWHQARGRDPELVWGVTLTFSLVLNIYLGIYDTTLLVLAALLTTGFVYGAAKQGYMPLPSGFRYWLVLLYFAPYVTQFAASVIHVQMFTPLLLLFGVYQLRLKGRAGSGHWADA